MSDNTLTHRIREIREVLDDDPSDPRWIRTMPRVGYRFVGEVTEQKGTLEGRSPAAGSDAGEPPARYRRYGVMVAVLASAVGLAAYLVRPDSPSPGSENEIESIAVLPLANLSGDPAQDYFAEGMTDQLTAEVSRIPGLRVISRTSAVRFADTMQSLGEIGEELNVDAVIEGSVLRVGDEVRITLRLVDVAADHALLTESYTHDLRDVLGLQDRVARAVAERIRTGVGPEDARAAGQIVPEAYDAYLRGRSAWNLRTPDGMEEALGWFQRAIELDPSYAAAWAGVADCYITYSGALLGLSELEAYPKARDAAERAIALDEMLAQAHTSLGSVKSEFDWDWAGAEAEYTRAIALNANHVTARQWYGEFLSFRGRHAESLTQLRHARDLDPLSPVVRTSLASVLLRADRVEEALVQASEAIAIDPAFTGGHLALGSAYLQSGMDEEAIMALERAVEVTDGELARPEAWLAHAYAVTGQTDRARTRLDALHRADHVPVSPYDLALIYAALDDRDRAFELLEDAYRERSWDLVQLQVDFRTEPLRNDPRFAELVGRIGS